jgi:hypothetical protein
MSNVHTSEPMDGASFTRRDLSAFLVVSSIAGAFAMFVVAFMAPLLLEPVFELPRPVWFGLGFPPLMWSLYPALRVRGRFARPPQNLSWRRYLLGSLLGALVGAVLLAGMLPWLDQG